jgi:antitoxin (DNA-binding transcriptional repressor) of toxin-antitoxin stability system
MIAITIRELLRNFSFYLKEIKKTKIITVLERKTPVADIVPHQKNIFYPGWKRPIKRIRLKKGNLSKSILENRLEER